VLIDYYRAIEDSSVRMLNAARQANWDAVIELEGACAVLIQQLKVRAQSDALDASAKAEKTKIMMRILVNDAHVRELVEPWLDTLDIAQQNPRGFLH